MLLLLPGNFHHVRDSLPAKQSEVFIVTVKFYLHGKRCWSIIRYFAGKGICAYHFACLFLCSRSRLVLRATNVLYTVVFPLMRCLCIRTFLGTPA